MDKLKDLLEEKNTYMHYFKNDDVKQKEKEDELTRTNVWWLYAFKAYSSHMTKLRVRKRTITARSASMSLSGANTERKEKLQSRNWEQRSQRKKWGGY